MPVPSSRRAGGRALACLGSFAVVVAFVLGTGGAASAGMSTLCTGYDACAAAGMSHAGYKEASVNSYWKMTKGHNCTNYVAYRLVRNGMPNTRPWSGSGNANNWGWANASRTDQSPAVGAVAWWDANAYPMGELGHVAYVEKVVSATEIIISQDSWTGYDFRWTRVTRSERGWPTGFIHVRDLAPSPVFPVRDLNAVAVGADGTTALAAIDTSGTLVTRIQPPGRSWGAQVQQGLPGTWAAVDVAVAADGTVALAAVKKYGSVFTRVLRPGGEWSGWSLQGDEGAWSVAAPPSLAAGRDRFELALVGASGTLFLRSLGLGGEASSDLTQHGLPDSWASADLAVAGDGSLGLVAVKRYGTVYSRQTWPDGAWQGFVQQGVAESWSTIEQPSIAGAASSFVLALTKKTGTVFTRVAGPGGAMSTFTQQGLGDTWSAADVAVTRSGAFVLVAVKNYGTVYTREAPTGGDWTGFVQQGTADVWSVTEQPTIAGGERSAVVALVRQTGTLYSRPLAVGGASSFLQHGSAGAWAR